MTASVESTEWMVQPTTSGEAVVEAMASLDTAAQCRRDGEVELADALVAVAQVYATLAVALKQEK